jgi:hypothetical protein
MPSKRRKREIFYEKKMASNKPPKHSCKVILPSQEYTSAWLGFEIKGLSLFKNNSLCNSSCLGLELLYNFS